MNKGKNISSNLLLLEYNKFSLRNSQNSFKIARSEAKVSEFASSLNQQIAMFECIYLILKSEFITHVAIANKIRIIIAHTPEVSIN